MQRTDRSVTILTGMIIAALYVILLVSFAQESYMRRDARTARAEATPDWTVVRDDARRLCRVERPLCSVLFSNADERRACASSVDILRRLVSHPISPLTVEDLRWAMRGEAR